MGFHAPSFYSFVAKWLRKLYNLHDGVDISLIPNSTEPMNDKLSKVLDEGSSIKQLYLNNMPAFDYDPGDKIKRRVEEVVARERHLVSPYQRTARRRPEAGP